MCGLWTLDGAVAVEAVDEGVVWRWNPARVLFAGHVAVVGEVVSVWYAHGVEIVAVGWCEGLARCGLLWGPPTC